MAAKKRKPATRQVKPVEPTQGTPEPRAWLLQQYTREDLLAGLHEVKEKGGLELQDFLHELEQLLNAN
jgi:hypothetical protein